MFGAMCNRLAGTAGTAGQAPLRAAWIAATRRLTCPEREFACEEPRCVEYCSTAVAL